MSQREISSEELVELFSSACEISPALQHQADAVAEVAPPPDWSAYLLSHADLLPEFFASFSLHDFAVVAVCRAWSTTWRQHLVRLRVVLPTIKRTLPCLSDGLAMMPGDVLALSDGNLDGQVDFVSPSSGLSHPSFSAIAADDMTNPSQLAVLSDGLVVSESSRVVKYSFDGKELAVFGHFTESCPVAVHQPSQRVFMILDTLTSTHQSKSTLLELDSVTLQPQTGSDGEPRAIGEGVLEKPCCLAISDSGLIVCSDRVNELEFWVPYLETPKPTWSGGPMRARRRIALAVGLTVPCACACRSVRWPPPSVRRIPALAMPQPALTTLAARRELTSHCFALRRLTLDGELVRTIQGNFFVPYAMAAAAGRVYLTESTVQAQVHDDVAELQHVGYRLHVIDIEAGVLMQTVNLPINQEWYEDVAPGFGPMLVCGDEIFIAGHGLETGIHVLGMAV